MGHTVRLFSVVTHIIWDIGQTAYLRGIGMRGRHASGSHSRLDDENAKSMLLPWGMR